MISEFGMDQKVVSDPIPEKLIVAEEMRRFVKLGNQSPAVFGKPGIARPINNGKNRSKKAKNGTRRAQIPRKPLDPPISWIVTQSLIFQIADPFCVFASKQIYKRPFLWSCCGSVQQWCRRETPEMKILC